MSADCVSAFAALGALEFPRFAGSRVSPDKSGRQSSAARSA